ncbi:MAG: OB-fold nucleic acid binding domain-containing protein [Holophagaceae bacterium]|uniref:OB-fold nucleic acid binding domain-containing protein n=1 Tax=Candidatus Geothrix skivensis TaxID=2954439 RepID=A0A9D7XMI3_9BACT|nr:OB-fold nucleic acid binding domain-containing protein [Candidatus Geothrix skivensis]
MRGALPLILVLTATFGCQSKKSDAVVAAPISGVTPAGAPAPSQGLSGKVLERIEAAPYCYLRLQTAQGEVWAAVPEAKIEKGTEVTIASPMLMNNFESKTLNKTFATVYFGTLAPAGGAPAAAAAPAAMPGAMPGAPTPQAPGAPVVAKEVVSKVDKATGPDAQTVADLWAKKASLKEKSVSIRGKVVKYNPGVMGKNWMHLQDGSGEAGKGNHDITVTSQDAVTKGDVVTVKGVVRLDKDFGAGYSYALIVEEAKVIKK